jgi:acyl carrier protein
LTGISDRVRRFVVGNFYLPDPNALADDTLLLDEGIVDSTGMLEIINFLEREFGFEVLDEEMIPANLNSVARIAGFVARKSGEERAA